MRVRATAARATMAGAVLGIALLAGCSSSSGGDAQSAATTAKATTTTSTAATASDGGTETVCTLFQDIASAARATGKQAGDPSALYTAQEWEQKIETTAKIADVAPPEYREDAEVYLELVKARAQLAADHGYGAVPTADRSAFIADHMDEQAKANELIGYVKSTCNLDE